VRIVHTEASLGWGGQEIRILTEAAGMIARGHQVEIACPREARIFVEAPRFGVPATALPIGRKRPRGIVALRRFLAEREVDEINARRPMPGSPRSGRSLCGPCRWCGPATSRRLCRAMH
jgi:hypothetical protein